MVKKVKEVKRRRWWVFVLVAAAIVTAVSTIAEAGSNRPLRYYSEDGFTAMTFYTNSSGDQNRSLWGINTDDPQCELDINGTICINRTGVYVYGVNLTPGSSGAPTGATYLTLSLDAGLTAERVLTAGNGITFTDTGANGVLRINLTGLQACSSGNVSMWDGSQWNCVNLTTSGSTNTFGYGLNVSGNHITIANLTACNPSTEYSVWDGSSWTCDNDGGGTDTNNYTSNISFNVTGSNYQLNLERVGMSNLTANFTITATGSSSGNITGSGITNYVARWLNGTNIGTGILYDTGSNVGIGTTSPSASLTVIGNGLTSLFKSNNTTTGNHVQTIYLNQTGLDDTVALNVVSENKNMSAMWLTGNEKDTGTLKINHVYPNENDSNAAALSLFTSGTTTAAQGIFIQTGNSTGNAIHITNGSVSGFTVTPDATRQLSTTITSGNINALLVQRADGTDRFRVDTTNSLAYFGATLRPNTANTSSIGQLAVPFLHGYITYLNTTEAFRNGSRVCTEDGTGCPAGGAGNVTGTNGTVGLPAIWSSATNLISSLISNFMIGDKAVNSSQLNTSNAGSSGQYLMLNSTGGMDWNTITTGGGNTTSTANGTAGYIPKYQNATNFVNSGLRDNGSHVYYNEVLMFTKNSSCFTYFSPDGSEVLNACN